MLRHQSLIQWMSLLLSVGLKRVKQQKLIDASIILGKLQYFLNPNEGEFWETPLLNHHHFEATNRLNFIPNTTPVPVRDPPRWTVFVRAVPTWKLVSHFSTREVKAWNNHPPALGGSSQIFDFRSPNLPENGSLRNPPTFWKRNPKQTVP